MDFSKEVLERVPWSYSMANKAHTCPFAFHQQYIAKAKSKESPRIENKVGVVVHTILELCVRGATLEQAYRKVVNDGGMLYEVEISIHNFRSAIDEFLKGLEKFKVKHRVVKVYPEKKLGLTKDFTTIDYWNKKGDCLIRGAIDLTLLTGRKQAVIIDHKSGAKKTLSAYDHQVGVYSLLINAYVSGLSAVRTAIHYVGASKNKKGTRTEWGPEYPIDVVQTRFREDITKWLNEAGEHAQTTTPKESWLCGFCGYQYLCPLRK